MSIGRFIQLAIILQRFLYRVINRKYYSIVDLVGRVGISNGEKIYISSYYAFASYSAPQKGGGWFVWDSSALKSTHNGVTIFSPTVPWTGAQTTLSAYHSATGETDPSGSGCWVRQYDELTVEMAGAIGDKTTDDATAFNKASAVLSATGGGTIRFSNSYLIDTNLTISTYTNFIGPLYGVDKIRPALSGDLDSKKCLLINSSATITLEASASFGKCLVIRKGLDLPFVDASAATTGISNFAGTAFTFASSAPGVFLHDMLIIGFQYAINGSSDRAKIERVYGDCTNGIKLTAMLDVTRVNDCHFWPFTIAAESWKTDTLLTRTGTAFEFSGTADWCKWSGCFSYGYAIGFAVTDCEHVDLVGTGTDYPSALTSTSIGVSISGDTVGVSLINHKGSGQGTGVQVDSTTTYSIAARILSCNLWENENYHIKVLNGRTVIDDCDFTSGSVGVYIDAASDGVIMGTNDFKSVTTPISSSGAGLLKSIIAVQNFDGCVDSAAGVRRVLSGANLTETSATIYSSTGLGNKVVGQSARGTITSPTVTQNNDTTNEIVGRTYDGSTFLDCASVRLAADGASSAGASPGKLIFGVTLSGQSTPSTALTIPSTRMCTITGSLSFGAPVTKTADFTILATENFLINNKSGSTCVVTLPSASAFVGRIIRILNYQAQLVNSASSNVVPVSGGAAGASILSATAGKFATLVSDGTNWLITESN